MQGLGTGIGGAMVPNDLAVALPTAKDAMVILCLPNGRGGVKHYKTHLDRLTRHSGFFAAAARHGTELKVRDGAYALDCSCQGFDNLLEFMRNRALPLHLTSDELASLHQLGTDLDMSKDFWRALAVYPAGGNVAANNGGHGLCNGAVCGGGAGRGGGSRKGILKHTNGIANGTKRTSAAAALDAAAPPPVAPRAKAYRRVLVDDMADPALCQRPFFDGEWYGQPAEMRVVDTYDAEATAVEHAIAEKQESSSVEPNQQPCAQQKRPNSSGSNGEGCGVGAAAKLTAAQAAAAADADALLDGHPLVRVRRFALLEFTVEAGGN